jgi:serine/threonine-protein kinase
MRTLGGRYRLDEEIGVGGMARVWRAYDHVLDREVAVKLLVTAGDSSAFERARNEARHAARLAHPNVAAVYDFGTSQRGGRGTAYLVMELLGGPLLSDRLRRGPLDWHFAARVAAEVSAGLAAAHGHDIVHRDVKPGNIALTPTGAKLLDFGIAAGAGEADRIVGHTIVGTAAYIAPERLQGRPVMPATDMYSVGVLLYQMITGELPWPSNTDEELLNSHRLATPAPLPRIDGLADEVGDIYAGCLDKRPSERPTAVAAALLLAATVDAQVYLPPISGPPQHRAPLAEDPLDAVTSAYAS